MPILVAFKHGDLIMKKIVLSGLCIAITLFFGAKSVYACGEKQPSCEDGKIAVCTGGFCTGGCKGWTCVGASQ